MAASYKMTAHCIGGRAVRRNHAVKADRHIEKGAARLIKSTIGIKVYVTTGSFQTVAYKERKKKFRF